MPESCEDSSATHRGQVRIGGVSVRIIGSRSCDVALDPALEPFRVETGASDMDIRVGWVAELSLTPGRKLFDSGTTWRLYEHESGFQFDFGSLIVREQPHKRLLVDCRFRRATLQMSAKFFSDFPDAADPLAYP